jgi:hypothetical protein
MGRKKSTQKTTAQAVVLETKPIETTKEVVIQPATPGTVGRAVFDLTSPQDLKIAVDNQTALRKVLEQYIRDNMVNKTDYGIIHVKKKEECPKPWECENPYHYSKPSLFKPGAEKFASLFRLTARFKKDVETCEMAGSVPGLFAYMCELVNSSGEVVGEGRGACSAAEKSGSMNTAIKIAQKRAQMDATLRYGALSGFFTQDMEDEPDAIVVDSAPPAKTEPVMVEKKPDFEKAMRMIRGLKNAEAVFRGIDIMEKSTNYPPDQKKKLLAALSLRLDEINATSK